MTRDATRCIFAAASWCQVIPST